jgi:hypothetical protein
MRKRDERQHRISQHDVDIAPAFGSCGYECARKRCGKKPVEETQWQIPDEDSSIRSNIFHDDVS